MSDPKFEVYEDSSKEWRFRLKATNGKIIAVSEGYKTKTNAVKGVIAVKRYASDAWVVNEDGTVV